MVGQALNNENYNANIKNIQINDYNIKKYPKNYC